MEEELRLGMENRNLDMKENWIKWNPLNLPEGDYVVTKFLQNIDGTEITLSDESNNISIVFDGITPLVRTSIEGIRMRTWGEVQQKYDNKYFFRNWFLYKVENSKLAKWAEEESCGFYKSEKLLHFCIVTNEDIIDVLSTFEPNIFISVVSKKEVH